MSAELAGHLQRALEGLSLGDALSDPDAHPELIEGMQDLLTRASASGPPGWCEEHLDGVFPWRVWKSQRRELSLLAHALFIEQDTTPGLVRLRLDRSGKRLESRSCRLGIAGDGRSGIVRYELSSSAADKALHRLSEAPEEADWVLRWDG